jgi:hypothetical protein
VRRALWWKRWHFAAMAGPHCYAALVLVDAGWIASAFAYLFDFERGEMAAEHGWKGLPGLNVSIGDHPGAGAHSTWRSRGAALSIERRARDSAYRVRARAPGLEIDAVLDTAGAPPALCAIAPIANGVANCTHKTMCLRVTGSASAGGRAYALTGTSGSMDHSSGVLARDTSWRWANAARAGLGFNLVEGFNGPVENALWLGEKLVPLGAARFDLDPSDPLRPWRITTECGQLELEFEARGARRQDVDLWIAKSRYVQPIGMFRGTLRPGGGAAAIEIRDLPGVTEDQETRW